MKLARAALALLLLASPAVAQVSPGQLGVTKNVDPQNVYVRDDIGNWVTIGTMSGGVFSPISSGGTFTWPGTADVATGGTAAPGGGTMPYVNAYLQSNATVYTNNAADAAPTVSGPLSAADSGITCVTTPSSQSACTGTPTANSSLTATITAAGYIGVQASITGGTANVTVQMEVSQDGITYYGRGLFLDTQLAPIWKNTLAVPFSGLTPGGGVSSYRARITGFTPLTGTPVVTITIRQGQSSNFMYIGNLPTSANGAGAAAAVNIQGNGNTMNPVLTDARQQAGVTLAAPTAPGVPASSGFVPTVNALGSFTATISGFSPTGNTLASPLTPGAGAVSSVALPAGGNAQAIFNTGTVVANVRLSVGSGTATANDIPIQPGSGCVLGVGGNTWVNAYNATAGSSINVASGTGLGNCPTGGGGGTAAAAGNVFQANLFVPSAAVPNTSASTATTMQQFAASGSTLIYLVNYVFMADADDTANPTFQIVVGTGTNCAGSQRALTPVLKAVPGSGAAEGPIGTLSVSDAGDALCVKTTTTQLVSWRIGIVQQ